MKKVIFCVSALLVSWYAQAQGWETTGAHDDFAQVDFYKNGTNQEGVVWYEDGSGAFSISRLGDGKMTIAATSAGGAGNYPLFGVNFNDANDDGTGTPFEVNLSGGEADIVIDIENNSTQLLFIDIKLVDKFNTQSQYEPNVSDVTAGLDWGDAPYPRKALNGFTLGPGVRKSIRIDLSSVPGSLGGLTEGAYTCSEPLNCPLTSYQINPAHIKAVLFRVNFGSANINLSQGDGDYTADTLIEGGDIEAYTGNIIIRDFKIGSTISTGVNQAVTAGSFVVYPNPASDLTTVTYEAKDEAEVTLTDLVGNVIFTMTTPAGQNKIPVTTAGLPTGMYILSVTTENGRSAQKISVR